MSFQEQVVVITGGNSGIGRGIAARFHQQGANVVVFGRNSATLADTVHALEERVLAVTGDVAKLDDLQHLADEVKGAFGRIDHLVVNAGVAQPTPFEAVDEASFDHTMNINLKGAFFTIQKALPLLREGSTITLVATAAVNRGFPNFSVYSASKAGLASLAKTLSAELIPRGIRVNVINPGPIETPIFDKMGFEKAQVEETKEGFSQAVPLQRMGRVEEVAGVATFLAGPDATYMTGTEINVDGGVSDI